MSSQDDQKKAAAEYAARQIMDGMWVGLGTGSTTSFAVQALGERVRRGELRINAVCTSSRTEDLARKNKIPIHPLKGDIDLDIYIDGADQVDPMGHMIKGGGGAHLREKMVALAASHRLIMVDSSKLVQELGRTFPVAIEVVRFGFEKTLNRLAEIPACEPALRRSDEGLFLTDEGNYVVDCHFPPGISDPVALEAHLKALTGVIETGLFIALCDRLVIGGENGVETRDF